MVLSKLLRKWQQCANGLIWGCAWILLFTLTLIGLPALLVRGCSWSGPPQTRQQQGPLVRLQLQTGQVVTLPLEEYLVGVVAAEMPAEFHPEALKAQAVAARTYTLRRLAGFLRPNAEQGHSLSDTDLSTDPENSQAWIPVSEMRRRWGTLSFGYYYGKIEAAVRDTAGEVVVYRGQLIDPVYHASCGGLGTEDATDVWGHDVPYLKGVACNWDPPSQQQPVAAAFTYDDLYRRLDFQARRFLRVAVLVGWSGSLTGPHGGGSRTCMWRPKPSRLQTSGNSSISVQQILPSRMRAAGLSSRPGATGMQ